MKTIRLILVAIVVLIVFVIAAFAQEANALSLGECLEKATANSHTLSASREKANAAHFAYQSTRAGRLPQLAVNGKADWISETMSLQLPANPFFAMPEIEFGDGTNYDIAVALNAPLFTGGSLRSSEKAAFEEARASHLDVKADSLELLYQVRLAYFRALAAQEAVDVARQGRDAIQRHLEELNGMIEQGMGSREAKLLTQARLSDAERGLINTQTALRSSRIALGRLIGEPGSEVSPAGSLDESLLQGDLKAAAYLPERPDLLAFDARSASNTRRIDAARGTFLPTVSAQAAMHYGKPGIDQVTNEWMDYATVGVRLSWTLFDWGQRSHTVQQVRAMENLLQDSRQAVEDGWVTRLATARLQLDSTIREHELAQQRVQLYEEHLILLTDRYRQGLATESERLDAEDEVTVARRNLVAAQANIRLAETDILFVLGQ